MKLMEQIWAKSNGTSLSKHTRDVVQAVVYLKEKQGEFVVDEWWKALEYAAMLHDLGKIDPIFQARLKKLNHNSQEEEIPHSLLSLFYIDFKLFPFHNTELVHTIISAVAFHHWREHFPDLLMGYQADKIRNKAEEIINNHANWENISLQLKNELQSVAEEFDLNANVISTNKTLIEYLCYNNLGEAGLLVPPYTLVFLPAKLRNTVKQDEREKLRIFISGNLMRADHFASLVEDNFTGIKIDDIESVNIQDAKTVIKSLNKTFNNCWQTNFFERYPKLQGQDIILVAPTGFGKTEFSYLWGAGYKTFIILPMRAAVNKIWNRTIEFMDETGGVGKEDVALLHGDAALEMISYSQKKGLQETEGERRKALDLARQLSKPYIIATADQIAPAALRYPGYERIFAALMNGALVIDEVQAYDPKAAAIIVNLIQQNTFLGGKTLLMTATLPPFIRKAIEERAGLTTNQIINLIDEPEFESIADSSRHRLRFLVHNGNYAEVLPDILYAAENGKKVLIVMNTVPAACRLYEQITDELSSREIIIDTLLLHSRFTLNNRGELEGKIVDEYMPNSVDRTDKACIVVATQIVEASLDIDADILFTEAAPADSLVQRMGRVFRRYARNQGDNTPDDANIVIMINQGKKKETDKDIQLSSGMRIVYDRNLVALSLVILLAKANVNDYLLKDKKEPEFLRVSPWKDCFFPRKKDGGENKKTVLPNEGLCMLINEHRNNSIVLTEREKMNWVELVYNTLELGRDESYPVNLGTYLKDFYETLDIMDHGYCSDRKRDAMRLFRDVNDVTVIPEHMLQHFYQSVRQWIRNCEGTLNYEKLAYQILPRFIVNCPYSVLTKDEELVSNLDIEVMIPLIPENRKRAIIQDKLTRWLGDIRVVNLPYDKEKGLIYYEL